MNRFLRGLLWLCLVFGLATFGVCLFYALRDWALLQTTNAQFLTLVRDGASQNALFVAEARQNVHRLNLFAEGVWALQGLILSAVAANGLLRTTT